MDPAALAPIRVCVWGRLLHKVWRVGLWSVDVGSVQSRRIAIHQTQRWWGTGRSVWCFSFYSRSWVSTFLTLSRKKRFLLVIKYVGCEVALGGGCITFIKYSLNVRINHTCIHVSDVPLSPGSPPLQVWRQGSWSYLFQKDVPPGSTSSWRAAGRLASKSALPSLKSYMPSESCPLTAKSESTTGNLDQPHLRPK